MKKMLMTASVPSMIGQFNMSNIRILTELGYEVHVACDFNDTSVWTEPRIKDFEKELDSLGVKRHQVDFSRNPIHVRKNLRSLKQINEILKKQHFSFIHCHTPIAGVISRIAARRNKVKVIYTAHGFHFYKGAPIKNWIIYFPIEKWLSKYTDVLITINREDYDRAINKLKAKRTFYIPGVGIDITHFAPQKDQIKKNSKRKEIGIPEDAILIISVGELSLRKNHQVVVEALNSINNSKIYYVIVGRGELSEYLIKIDKTGRLKLLGYRADVADLLCCSDLFIFPSIQEGLPVALMEAMASGLPVICSRIRGNTDLVSDNNLLFEPRNVKEVNRVVENVLENGLSLNMQNVEKMRDFDISVIDASMKSIYVASNILV